MTHISLAQADLIANKALEKGRALNFLPLTVVILDAGGHVVVTKREDGSGILRVEIATGKAWGTLGMGLGSRNLANRAAKNPAFYTALAAASDGKMIPVVGGVLIRNPQGAIIGAIGISGDVSDNDEICCIAGIEAAGLLADPG
jgi:uncharacterized protein GlcG (DUF336 family)